mgnify:CR=1 FL=1
METGIVFQSELFEQGEKCKRVTVSPDQHLPLGFFLRLAEGGEGLVFLIVVPGADPIVSRGIVSHRQDLGRESIGKTVSF